MIRPLLVLLFTATSLRAAGPAVFTLKTMTAQMKYDASELLVQPGQAVKIFFENGDDLPHNLVFCQPGTDTAAMAMKQMEKPEEALKRNWLPDDKRIWLSSKMLNPHEKQELSFTAPEKPGSYPYVCTFPGHALTMRGEMKVAPAGDILHDLQFALYLGNWKQLPDFSELKPHREGKVEDNLLQVKLDDYKNEFGVVYTGKLIAPKKGSYRFFLASDDGARILIDGKEVINHDGVHPSSDIKEKGLSLDKGAHEFRLEYFQGGGQIELYAAWKGSDFQITPLSKWLHPHWKGGAKKQKEFDPIPLVAKGEPVIYRNFIQGAGNRAIGVGYPGGINLAWSAESMNLALIWRGAFIDAAKHWNSRGGGHEKPLGYDVLQPTGEVTPAFHVTDKADAEWPKWDKMKRFDGFEWKGYTLDAQRLPTFRYTWQGAEIEESFATEGNGNKADSIAKLIRTVKVSGTLPANAWYRIGVGSFEAKDDSFVFKSPKPYRVTATGAQLAGQNLVIPAKASTITITYQWAQ
ncbi:PA14 domain-containing protein [Prosthecobacter sp.]|uniref:PA14 domain-containing protein n=1 Tax=Prosthecobacter sp. TaxID=1965333 RepID=UPI002ABA4615|nr:PA14 domain-containing protein [Prosthecobacter sp.]MDZ4403316.1 PA14 domain-containing protein [Prosthecobacter sp.]